MFVRSFRSVLVVLVLMVSACSKPAQEVTVPAPGNTGSAGGFTIVPNGSPSMAANNNTVAAPKAEDYALIGEALLQSPREDLAPAMFEQALALDKLNARANFYLALVRAAQSANGFLNASKHLGLRYGISNLNRLNAQMDKVRGDGFKMGKLFSRTSEVDYLDFDSAQKDAKTKVIPELKLAIERIGNINISNGLYMNHASTKIVNVIDYNRSGNQCRISSFITCLFSLRGASETEHVTVVDNADLEAMKGSFVATLNSVRVALAYQQSGMNELIELLQKLAASSKRITTRDVIKAMNSIGTGRDLFTLDSAHELDMVTSDMSSAIKNAEYLASMQDMICMKDGRLGGANLLKSICMTYEAADEMNKLFAGPTMVTLGGSKSGGMVQIKMNLVTFLKNPPADLKALAEGAYDAKGNLVSLKDSTLGGLFPDGDVVTKINELRQKKFRNQNSWLRF